MSLNVGTRAVVLSIAVSAIAADDNQETFRAQLRMVPIYATVSDRTGRFVTGLSKQDFQVLDDGRPVEIALFSDGYQPITSAIMLDMSVSVVTQVVRVRESVRHFVDALLPGDRVRIGSFGDEIALSPLLTGDKTALARILHEELWPGGPTPLWNALYAAVTSLDGATGRRVVLSLTDGEDSGGLPGWTGTAKDVEDLAIGRDIMVYAVGMEGGRLDRHVMQLAERTGGGHFQVRAGADLSATFARVADELRHQYLLGFAVDKPDGKPHTLEVRVTRPGLRVRARRTYR